MSAVPQLPRPIRLANLANTPSNQNVPLYQSLARDPRVDFTVIFASDVGVRTFDYGFGQEVGWDLDLLSGYDHFFLKEGYRSAVPAEPTFWSLRNWDVAPVLKRGRYDVLWLGGYNSVTHLLATITQRTLRGEVLFRDNQTLLDPRSLVNVVAKQFILRALFSQGRALYTSTENRRWFQHFGLPDHRLFETPYSVDNEWLRAAARSLQGQKQALRREFRIEDDSGAVIVTVSRLMPKKQPQFLLEAFRRARESERCVLLIVGSGPLEQELRDKVRREQIPDVVFAGFLNRSQISRAYAAADAFALLSRERETFGLVVAEAMNFSLPVIVSDRVGCAADLVSNDYNGFVVSSRDPSEAAMAIEQLVRDTDLREGMGSASLERITKWDVGRTAEGIIAAATDAVAP